MMLVLFSVLTAIPANADVMENSCQQAISHAEAGPAVYGVFIANMPRQFEKRIVSLLQERKISYKADSLQIKMEQTDFNPEYVELQVRFQSDTFRFEIHGPHTYEPGTKFHRSKISGSEVALPMMNQTSGLHDRFISGCGFQFTFAEARIWVKELNRYLPGTFDLTMNLYSQPLLK
jgi:hypothetical protein